MFATKRLYEEEPALLTCSAKVLDVISQNNTAVVILNQTVFRPQSIPTQGNDESVPDAGLIESEHKRFHVIRTELAEDTVRHIGTFEEGPFEIDEEVTCALNEEFRKELKENQID